MSNTQKKLKKEKKAKERKEKAKRAKARQLEEKKALKEKEQRTPPPDRQAFQSDSKQPSSKPSGRSSTPGHRTQGK